MEVLQTDTNSNFPNHNRSSD